MEKVHNNSMFKYLLVLCLSFTLLLSQVDRWHMHLEHDDHAVSSGHDFDAHIVAAHPESTLHDFGLTNHHDGHQDNHSAVAVDVSTDKLLMRTNLLNSLVLIIFFMMLFQITPRLRNVSRWTLCNIPITSCYYLLRPPLRAPPIK